MIFSNIEITALQVIDKINNGDYKRTDPQKGLLTVNLNLFQLRVIKLMFNAVDQRNVLFVKQLRQAGMSSLFVWIAHAVHEIDPRVKVGIIVDSNILGLQLIKISRTNSIEKKDRFISVDLLRNIDEDRYREDYDIVLIDINRRLNKIVGVSKLFPLIDLEAKKDTIVVVNGNCPTFWNMKLIV